MITVSVRWGGVSRWVGIRTACDFLLKGLTTTQFSATTNKRWELYEDLTYRYIKGVPNCNGTL